MSGEVIHIDFTINERKIDKAARKLLSLEEIRTDYEDVSIINLAEQDLMRAMKRLNLREKKEVSKRAREIAAQRELTNKRYLEGMEE